MSNEIVKFSNQFNNVALRKFDATQLDVLMAIASRVKEKGTEEVTFSFAELKRLMQLDKNLTNKELADKVVGMNTRLLALNYMFTTDDEIIQFALFTEFRTKPSDATLTVAVNQRFAFLLNDLTAQFTRFELAEFTGLKSRYAKEFYRRAKQYRSTGIWAVSREDFCRLLDVPKSANTTYLNQKVMKPIVQECGPLLHLKVERQYTRRKLTGFVFTFSREVPPEVMTVERKPSEKSTATKARKFEPSEGDIQKVLKALGAESETDPMRNIELRKKALKLLHLHGSVIEAVKAVQD